MVKNDITKDVNRDFIMMDVPKSTINLIEFEMGIYGIFDGDKHIGHYDPIGGITFIEQDTGFYLFWWDLLDIARLCRVVKG